MRVAFGGRVIVQLLLVVAVAMMMRLILIPLLQAILTYQMSCYSSAAHCLRAKP